MNIFINSFWLSFYPITKLSSLWSENRSSFKILIFRLFWLIFDDVTVTLSLIVLSYFFHKLTVVLSYSIPKFLKIEYHRHGYKNRLKKAHVVAATPLPPAPSLLILRPRWYVRSEKFFYRQMSQE